MAKVRLTIYDGALGAAIAETLSLPVADARKGKIEEHGLRIEKTGEISVYTGASDGMPLLGTAKSGSVLRGQQNFNGWWKVDALAGVPGYVQVADVVVSPTKAKKYTKGAVQATPWASAPEVTVDVPSLVVDADTLHLKGHVHDAKRLRDMFIFVNEKKVYFHSLEDVPRGEHGLDTDFDVKLAVKPGSNSIAVIVREDEDMIGRKFFGIFRNAAKPVDSSLPTGQLPTPPGDAPSSGAAQKAH